MQIMNMTGYVLFWYLLGVKLTWGHAHKTRSWYLLGVTLKNPTSSPVTFIWESPPHPAASTGFKPVSWAFFFLFSFLGEGGSIYPSNTLDITLGGLYFRAAVLYQLSYQYPYIESRPIFFSGYFAVA